MTERSSRMSAVISQDAQRPNCKVTDTFELRHAKELRAASGRCQEPGAFVQKGSGMTRNIKESREQI